MTQGLLAAFGTLGAWTISAFFTTNASRAVSPALINKIRLLYAVLALAIIVMLSSGLSPVALFTRPDWRNWLGLGCSGIVGLAIGDVCGFTGLKILGTARASLFNTFAPAVALLLGMFWLHETINWVGVAGIMLTISAVTLLLGGRRERSEVMAEGYGDFKKGILFCTLGTICQGGGVVLSRLGIAHQDAEPLISPFHQAWIRLLVAFGVIFVADLIRRKNIVFIRPVLNNRVALKNMLIGSAFGSIIGATLAMLTVRTLEVSVAQTVFSLVPVCIFIVGWVSGRKTMYPLQLMSLLAAIAGVMLLIWRNQIV